MRYIVAFVLCLAVVSARRHGGGHRRGGNNNQANNANNQDGTQAQVQEGRWFSVQPDSSYWSRTVFRLKNSNVHECESKCVSYKGGCMSFDFHKRTGTCYGRPEGAWIFDDENQRERVHHSNHYNFYYISSDDLVNAQYQWENESPEDAARVLEEQNQQNEEERQRQEEEQERERARQRHQEMLAERQRRIEYRKQQEAERQRQQEQNRQNQQQNNQNQQQNNQNQQQNNNNRFTQPEPEPEIVEIPVQPVRPNTGNSYIHDPDFTCISGVKSYADGRLMSDTTEYEKCEVRSYSTPHKCYQLSLDMTMRTGGITVRTSSYTGGCFYPEMQSYLNKGRDAAAASLPDDMTLDFYSFATCDQKNCYDLTQSVDGNDDDQDDDGFEPGFLCPLHGCTADRIGCRGNLKTDENGCTLCECEEEEHQCEHNQVWNECGTACPLRCGEEEPAVCTYNCVIGCACPDGLWLTDDGQCVREQECPELYPNYDYPSCPLHGCTPERIGCYPGAGLKQDNNGCTLCECEDPPVQDCPHNQMWLECGSACPDKCGEERALICTANCVIGCGCPQGMWETQEGYCVDEQDCPAEADDIAEECYEAVGMEDGSLGDDQISSSSAYWGYPAHYARLNGNNAWAPQLTKAGEYLEVDFGKRINVVGVSTQGKKYYFQDTYITKYNLMYLDRRDNWVFYNNQQEFDGNENADEPRSNFFFENPIHTRKLRFVINDWEQQILMRAEVYAGC